MLIRQIYRWIPKLNQNNFYTRRAALLVFASTLLMFGCEAPLIMDKVTTQRGNPLQRTDFFQAFAKNDHVAVLVGNSGVVLRSSDAETWSRITLTGSPSLLDIDNCPNQNLIALSFDNNVWISQNNGENWTSIAVPTQEQLMTIDCAPNGKWWVAGGFSTILNSNDDGQNWESSSLEEDAIITNLTFLNENDAVATAEFGMILITQDGGTSWDLTGFLPNEFYPHTSHFTSTSEGWIGGLNGFIYHTKDSGNNWQQQPADSAVPIYQFVQGDSALYALGDNATVMNLSGSNWKTIQPATAPVYLRAAMFFNNKLLAAGGRGMFLTIDPNVAVLSADKVEQ